MNNVISRSLKFIKNLTICCFIFVSFVNSHCTSLQENQNQGKLCFITLKMLYQTCQKHFFLRLSLFFIYVFICMHVWVLLFIYFCIASYKFCDSHDKKKIMLCDGRWLNLLSWCLCTSCSVPQTVPNTYEKKRIIKQCNVYFAKNRYINTRKRIHDQNNR